MILQALCDYYDALVRRGEVTPPGWDIANVSFALELDGQGALCGVRPLKFGTGNGGKESPQRLRVPEQVKKTSGVAANFLCDNGSYFLGVDGKGKPERTAKCFESARVLHRQILEPAESPAAKAVCAFFDGWRPAEVAGNPILRPYLEDILKGANLVFSFGGRYVQEDPAVRDAWDAYRAERSAGSVIGRCLVTGKRAPIARLHPGIKGIRDAQSSGASLVSFNASAFESYGHEGKESGQGQNAPVSEEAAFKYGAVLKQLIDDREHLQYIGDTAVVFWAEDAESLCRDVFYCAMFGGESEAVSDEDLRRAIHALAGGNPVDVNGVPLRPENRFYVLGLAPNAGRLSVRFFLRDTFGKLLSNVCAHSERLSVVKPAYVGNGALPLWKLLGETVNPNSRDKKASPPMAGAVLRAILSDRPYPASLLEQTALRIRAERDVSYGKAAILKAYFLKNKNEHIPEEVFTVELNEQSAYPPYVLGRLFAVLERVQTTANPGINATVKDKYFNSASATPKTIFPLLVKLSQNHLRKLESGMRVYYEKQIGELMCRIRETLPARLSLAEQSAFHLGYYHQVQKFYEKKDKGESENV